MDIKLINEALKIKLENGYKYADIDAKSIYDNCVNKDLGSHTFAEADLFKKFVGIDENTTEEELRAIRNTLVRYWADNMDKTDAGFKMGDQMQFFTTVIDMAIDNLPQEKRIQEKFDPKETKVPTEEDLDDIYDCLQTLLKIEYFVTTDEDLKKITAAYEVIQDLYNKHDSF